MSMLSGRDARESHWLNESSMQSLGPEPIALEASPTGVVSRHLMGRRPTLATATCQNKEGLY
jgi:hypothetical protein